MAKGGNGFDLGSNRPDSCVARSLWAEDQIQLGATSIMCCICGKWWFDFECHPEPVKSIAYRDKAGTKPVEVKSRICLPCHARRPKGFESLQDEDTGEWIVKGLDGGRENTNDTAAVT